MRYTLVHNVSFIVARMQVPKNLVDTIKRGQPNLLSISETDTNVGIIDVSSSAKKLFMLYFFKITALFCHHKEFDGSLVVLG